MSYRTSLPLHPTEYGGDNKKKKKKNQYKSKSKSGNKRKKKKKGVDWEKVGAAIFATGLGGAVAATTYKGGHDSRKK